MTSCAAIWTVFVILMIAYATQVLAVSAIVLMLNAITLPACAVIPSLIVSTECELVLTAFFTFRNRWLMMSACAANEILCGVVSTITLA